MSLFLGVDAGGSTTVAILADQTGQVVGVGVAGPGNFQGPGVEAARKEVQKSIQLALNEAGTTANQVCSAYFGMAGADRDEDFRIVQELLAPVLPNGIRWSFENDAILGLWAGTIDGIGVGVICGTGTNVVGVNGTGKKVQVGGMGFTFGDRAGGSYIGQLAIARAMRGKEGRGEPTRLYERICEYYKMDDLLDLVDWMYEGKSLGYARLVPLVVEVAGQGDRVAQSILVDVGHELGVSTNAAIRQLFNLEERVKVVGIGSVFQKSQHPFMYNEFVKVLGESGYSKVEPQILRVEPVAGAIFGAAALVDFTVDEDFKEKIQVSLDGRL